MMHLTKRMKIALVVGSLVLATVLVCVFARAMSATDPSDPLEPKIPDVIATTVVSPVISPVEDTGVFACKMMHDDKASSSKPDAKRSQEEIALLIASDNDNLQKAGKLLKTGDVETGFEALSLLMTGCAELGFPI